MKILRMVYEILWELVVVWLCMMRVKQYKPVWQSGANSWLNCSDWASRFSDLGLVCKVNQKYIRIADYLPSRQFRQTQFAFNFVIPFHLQYLVSSKIKQLDAYSLLRLYWKLMMVSPWMSLSVCSSFVSYSEFEGLLPGRSRRDGMLHFIEIVLFTS